MTPDEKLAAIRQVRADRAAAAEVDAEPVMAAALAELRARPAEWAWEDEESAMADWYEV